MANAQQILARKDRDLVGIAPDATVLEAARLMNEHHIGSLVVESRSRLVGIITERDVMRRVVARCLDPAATAVREVMTSPVAVAAPHTVYSELCAVMREKRIRHLPVVEDDAVVGMISIGDLNRVDHDEQERTIRYLELYMSVA